MEIYYTAKALDDLEQIRQSILEKFLDPRIAEQVLRAITKCIRNLEVFPYMGTELVLSVAGSSIYRYLFVKKNYIFYRVEGERIRIIRILNERQDYREILSGIPETE